MPPHGPEEGEAVIGAAACRDCKHWDSSHEPDSNGESDICDGWGTCGSPRVVYGYGRGKVQGDELLQVEDDEGWGMTCSPDFGCVLFEKRPNA